MNLHTNLDLTVEEGVGTEQKTVSGETEYTVTCSSKFVPYEFPANVFSK